MLPLIGPLGLRVCFHSSAPWYNPALQRLAEKMKRPPLLQGRHSSVGTGGGRTPSVSRGSFDFACRGLVKSIGLQGKVVWAYGF